MGIYSLTAGCRGQTTYPAKKHNQQLYVDPSGDEASMLLSNPDGPPGAMGGDQSRVSAQFPPEMNCSNQTLTGIYRYHARGFKNNGIHVESGFENYDGRGRLTNTYSDSHSRRAVHTSGTYTVARDCTATVTYAGGDTYRLYVASDGNTFSWLQTKGLRGVDFFGGKEHRISEIPNYTLSPKPRTRPAAARADQAAGATTSI